MTLDPASFPNAPSQEIAGAEHLLDDPLAKSELRPVATVVITTHNRPDMVARAVESALHQSLREVEVIVIDDGSSLPLDGVLRQDNHVRLIRNDEPRGLCAARNRGLATARGRWITFLDDDDELLPEMLERSLVAIERSELPPPVAVLSGIEVVDSLGLRIEQWLPVTMPKGRDFFLEGSQEGEFRATNTLVVPTKIVRDIGGWDERMRAAERYDFFLRLNQVCSFQGLKRVTYRMKSHDGARARYQFLHYAEAMDWTIRKHRKTFLRHRRRSAHYLGSMGVMYLNSGRWGRALRATSRAVLMDPTRAKLYRWWFASIAGPKALKLYRDRRRGQGETDE